MPAESECSNVCFKYRQYQLLTLGGISTGPVLHQNIIERLMMAVRQAVDVHVSNPLMSHHAGGVPAIDDTVIAIPN